VPSLTRRDQAFLAWNVAVGLLCAAIVVHDPALQAAAIPPFMWLLLGMLAFELGASVIAGGAAPMSNVTRFLGLCLSLGVYTAISALLIGP